MGKLRDQMLADLQLCGAKPRTQETYLREAENLARYFNRSPAELGENELKEYLLYLIKERHLSEGTFRFYVAGLKFLYRTTLKREWPVEKIKHPKRRRKLPIVLDLSEVESLFSVTKNLKHKAMLMITYSSGLRVSETARLKMTDLDSKRMTVRIRQGKGGDRYKCSYIMTSLLHLLSIRMILPNYQSSSLNSLIFTRNLFNFGIADIIKEIKIIQKHTADIGGKKNQKAAIRYNQ